MAETELTDRRAGERAFREGDPLLTFAILAYNQQDIIADAVAGALAQTYARLEIVISDDASTDGTFARIEEAVAGYAGPHRILLNRNQSNLGIAAHVDRVMTLSSGEVVVVNAGDDRSLPERTACVAAVWRESRGRAHAIHSACIKLDAHGRPAGVARPPAIMRGRPTARDIADGYHHCIGAGLAWSRDVFDAFGPLCGHADVEDHVIPFRAGLLGEIRYIDTPLVLKRPGGVANLEVAGRGRDIAFGTRLRDLRWTVTDYRQFDADLEAASFVPPEERAEIRAAVRRFRAWAETEYDVAHRPPLARLARAPFILALAAIRRDRRYARTALLYGFAPLSIWAHDALHALRDLFGQQKTSEPEADAVPMPQEPPHTPRSRAS